MQLDKLDLSRCLFDPRSQSFLSDIKSYEEFNEDIPYKLPKKRIMTYIVLIYDMDSPLRKEIRDLTARKIMALDLSGFKRDKKTGHFERPIELMLEGRNPQIRITSYNVCYTKLLRIGAAWSATVTRSV